jgi:Lsr2
MAQKVQVILVDDVDGGEAEESVSFALDGVSYEIDLSAANAESLRDALAHWVGHARKISGRASRGRPAGRSKVVSSSKADTAEKRAWGRENGFAVSDRGRVSAEVIAAFEAAH